MKKTDIKILKNYFEEHISDMMRCPNGGLKYPYLEPGTGYEEMLWDWDSFWAAKALICMNLKEAESKYLVVDFLKGCVLNFLDASENNGYIPIVLSAKGTFDKMLDQYIKNGKRINQHKPFLCQNILQISEFCKNYEWIRKKIDVIEKYLDYYHEKQFDEKTGLYVFVNDIMIGADNDPSVFGRPDFSCASLLLNSFLVMEFEAFLIIRNKLNLSNNTKWEKYRDLLVAAIENYCFDEKDKYYYSVDVQVKTHRDEIFHHGMGAFWNCLPIKIRSWTGFLPLYAGVVSKERAEAVIHRHAKDLKLFCKYGIRTLAADEKMYNVEASSNPSNWLGPIWGISNYVVFKAFMRYGFQKEARKIAEGTIEMFANDIRQNGGTSESYNPETGKPLLYSGFLNWNVLALEMAKDVIIN